ncbi:hypothetical protein ACJRO7_021482 [Eucalyptus globulus]|uniref:Uncharacterized protein n=1 Tax=Eucalyptus globulus TaxID=34317 RepID=A0ABD3KR61_EUCGL
MGGKFSKNKQAYPSSMEDSYPRYQSDLTSYEAAYGVNRSLRDFEKTLHDQADRVIGTLAASAKAQSLTIDDLGELISNLDDVHKTSVRIIIESQEDIRNDKELSDLVNCYFGCVQDILEFYSSLDDCLSQAYRKQWKMHDALTDFEEERGENVGGKKYVEIRRELKKCKEATNPFTDKFFTLFHSVNKQQVEMLQKLQSCKMKLDNKIKSARACRRVTNAIFVAAFVATVVFSVVAVAIGAPPVAIAVATALPAPIATVGEWCHSRLENYQRELKKKRELINLMTVGSGTNISIDVLETIQSLVSKLETEIGLIMPNADFALGEEQEEAVKRGVSEIKKRVEDVMAAIDDLCEQAEKSRRHIEWARQVIKLKLITYSSH